jgi:diguanylate cyclase (GGDEF)-like protein
MPMMQDTLNLISIQHELGMSIGLDLRLQPMLKDFIQVALKRLGLSGIDFYFNAAKIDDPHNVDSLSVKLSHVLSVPEVDPYKELQIKLDLNNMFDTLKSSAQWREIHNEATKAYVYYFNLGEIGLVCLHRKNNPLEPAYLALLSPIFERLAISCQASLEHEQLLQAIEARKLAESTITHQLLHDELTRLPNRRMLMEELNKEIKSSDNKGFGGALLFIDLDRFKAINDTLGHEVGDELLKTVASILSQSVRKKDLVARLSGDEFVVLLKNIPADLVAAQEVVDIVLNKFFTIFNGPIQAGEHLLHISPSIGIEFYSEKNVSPERVLRNADTAMYIAKAQGQYSAVYYNRQMSADLEQRLDIEKQLQIAIKTCDQFSVEYQPQFNSAGECIGAEALTRWHKENGEFVSPALFIPIAEETGLILELGKWVMKTACDDIRALEELDIPGAMINISVNVSAVQFNQSEFVPQLINQIEQSNIKPQHLCIELTESALINNVAMTIEKIVQLKHYGVEVSIDDFGTGYSSLSYLNRFPITTLKIDQAFVRNMHIDPGNKAIVETIVALADSLSLSVIAEGVETVDELMSLQTIGCDCYQGFYFSKSVHLERLINIIRQVPLNIANFDNVDHN